MRVITLVPGRLMHIRGKLDDRRPGLRLLQRREELGPGSGHRENESETRNGEEVKS